MSFTNYQAWTSLGCPANQNSNACTNLWTAIQNQVGLISQELKRQAIPQQPSLDPDVRHTFFSACNVVRD